MRLLPTLSLMGIALAIPVLAHASDCRDLSPPSAAVPGQARPISATDLVRLRDIGPVENNVPRAAILAVSPDGTRVAFQMRRADPASNDYCLGMFVIDLARPATPRQIDAGGQVILRTPSRFGFAVSVPPGTLLAVTPKWSPDGKAIAYLRRDDDRTQLWTADPDGNTGVQRTRVDFDVEDFAWGPGGASLVFSGRPALVAARQDIQKEGAKGFLFDERFQPLASNTPLPREPILVEDFTVDLASGEVRPATARERTLLQPPVPPGLPGSSQWATVADNGTVAWAQTDPNDVSALPALHARVAGKDIACKWTTCGSVLSLWWAGPVDLLTYLRRDGALGEDYAFYQWAPGQGAPRLLTRTNGIFEGCQPTGPRLICAYEAARQPREVVSVDLTTGDLRPLFDPNPEFAALKLGQVQRLTLTNDLGVSTWADLVLPPDHQAGQKHPLVIVEYESRGFLRGGTGDEYPIQAYAAAGFAVLSFQRPPDYGLRTHPKTYAEDERLSRTNWVDRRSVLELMEAGIRQAADLGVVDSGKVGLTGLSEGSSAVQFAAINSHAFKAFAMSSCCDEESVVGFLDGPAGVTWIHAAGYPLLNDDSAAFWKDDSFRQNASRIDTPILVQDADREYGGALEGVMALQQLGKPVEMYVYPDEYHIRWQPAHRLATYERSLDWFKFWLMSEEDPNPEKAGQYRRWETMRTKLGSFPPADSAGH